MIPGDKMIVPGDLEHSYNVVTYIWSVEGRHIYSFVTIEVELQ